MTRRKRDYAAEALRDYDLAARLGEETSISKRLREENPDSVRVHIKRGNIPFSVKGSEHGGETWLRVLAPLLPKITTTSVTLFPLLEKAKPTTTGWYGGFNAVEFRGRVMPDQVDEELPVAGIYLPGRLYSQGSLLVACSSPAAREQFLGLFSVSSPVR